MTVRDVSDTIVAISTPAGRSPRAIVRLSGPDALRIGSEVFESRPGIEKAGTYRSAEGAVCLRADGIRCRAVAYVMRAPRSYTREDIVEFHVPGSPPLLAALADALTRAGARPAEPGEFTRRAFLNGRIDLTQAEAVQGVIAARSGAELRAAQAQLGGSFRRAVESIRGEALQLVAEVEASIDFVEDDIRLIEADEAGRRAGALAERIEAMAGRESPAPPTDGLRTALCGLPNAGKSSLLNALAGETRAIVTPVPGTTRDTVEHAVTLDGVRFRLIDTAGLRRARHAVERESVARANRAAETADLVVLVVDGSSPMTARGRELAERLAGRTDRPLVTALNKCDLPTRISRADERRLRALGRLVRVSALRGDGLDELRSEMGACVRSGAVEASAHGFWLTVRHRAALRRAAESARRAESAIADGLGLEFAAADLHESLDALGEIVGVATPDDVLDAIFAQFCIGK